MRAGALCPTWFILRSRKEPVAKAALCTPYKEPYKETGCTKAVRGFLVFVGTA